MKPFSLNEYIQNKSLKVITRDGRSVRIICTDINNTHPIVAAIKRADGTDDVELYPKHGHYLTDKECSYDLFFEIDETSEQTKNVGRFDPNTLQPFDRVLARDTKRQKWDCGIFSYIDERDEFKFNCSGNCYCLCIPYDENTKHLVGTNDDAPEYYRYWEK